MRTRLKVTSPDTALTRILLALERELLDASEEEIIAAAKDLGMNPEMKGSAAFAGLKYPAKPQISDFFEFEVCRNAQLDVDRAADAVRMTRKRLPRSKGLESSKQRKGPRGK